MKETVKRGTSMDPTTNEPWLEATLERDTDTGEYDLDVVVHARDIQEAMAFWKALVEEMGDVEP